MSKTINIFVCYKQKSQELPFSDIEILLDEVKKEYKSIYYNIDFKIDVRTDRAINYRQTLEELIKQSDIFLMLVTKDWMKSKETFYEFIQAKTMLKPIIIIKNKNVRRNLHFFDGIHFIEYSNTVDKWSKITKQISDHIKTISQNHIGYSKLICKLLKPIGQIPEFKIKIALEELSQTVNEIEEITREKRYNIDIGLQRNYLYRAIPMFEAAEQIYAVSKYSTSDFWTKTQKNILDGYLKAHENATDVYRLFVFETVKQLVEYREILKEHESMYGKKGGVFVTSLVKYEQLFKSIRNYQTGDFGILYYKNDDKSEMIIKAELSSDCLTFDNAKPIESNEVIKIFKYGRDILKWDNKKMENMDDFILQIRNIFPNEERKVKHCVFISSDNNNKKEIENWIIDFKKHYNTTRDCLYTNIKVLSNIEDINDITDKQYRGALRRKIADYALIFDFKNLNDLQSYYGDSVHSTKREELYKILNPDVSKLYDKIEICAGCFTRKECDITCFNQKKTSYSEIERNMANYITRIDVYDNESIDSIIQTYLSEIKSN